MTAWRVGRKLGRTLYRDEQLVGMVDSPEIALEIVAAMRVVERLVGPAPPPESGRERSPEPPSDPAACRFCHHHASDHARSVGGGLMACARCPLGLCGERP